MDVAAVGLRLLDHQRPIRLALVQLVRDHLDQPRRPGEVGLTFTSGIASRLPLLRRREIDFLARGEPHIGLFPVAPAAPMRPKRRGLPLTLDTVTESTLVLNISSTAALISGLVARSATRNTYWRSCRNEGALLRHDRREHDAHQALGAGTSSSPSFQHLLELRHCGLRSGGTLGKRTSATGLAWRTVITSTFGRLREESSRFWSISS